MTSVQPINDPYLDMLVELNWSSGRLVRQYTFLLDPPEFKPASSPEAGKTAQAAPYVSPFPAVGSTPTMPPRPPRARKGTPAALPAMPVAPDAQSYVVAPGDTAFKIAKANKPADVSVDQMLIALFRANPQAFDAQNVNRLKAGAVVRIPDAQAVAATDAREARRQLSAHMNDFAELRSAAAEAGARAPVSGAGEARQAASGKVAAKIDEVPLAGSATQDKVRLSKLGETIKPDVSVPAKASAAPGSAEDAAAKDRMVEEANTRVALLEKNIADLEKLLQLKNQNLAELQKQAQGKAPESGAAAGATSAPAVSTSGATAPTPSAAATVAKPAPAKAADAKTSPGNGGAGFMDGLFANPLALYGILGILLALLLLAVYQLRRKNRLGKFEDSFLGGNSGMRANSLFGITGGQSVDTSNSTFSSNFLPQTGQAEANEVDPIAEAEVYIAYGRDAQAEEILKEALRTQPQRNGVRLKLLEIYAKRSDVKSFETVANELYAATGGRGDEWQQAVALGRTVDPSNPLFVETRTATVTATGAEFEPFPAAKYTPKGSPKPPSPDTATQVMPPIPAARSVTSSVGASTSSVTSPFARDLVQSSYSGPVQIEPVLDTNLVKTEPFTATDSLTMNTEPRISTDAGLDFTLSSEVHPPVTASPVIDPAASDHGDGGLDWAQRSSVDFNFDLQDGSGQSTEPFANTMTIPDTTPRPAADLAATPMANLLKTVYAPRPGTSRPEGSDADLSGTRVVASPEPASHTTSDFGAGFTPSDTIALGEFQRKMPNIDLNLDKTGGKPPAAKPSNWQEMATKLDLAIAYRDIGDKDGARELLGEVVKGGDSVQVQKAKELLSGLD